MNNIIFVDEPAFVIYRRLLSHIVNSTMSVNKGYQEKYLINLRIKCT